jgi:hypothetical protein
MHEEHAATDHASDGVMPLLFAMLCFAIAAYSFFVVFVAVPYLVSRNNPAAALRGQIRQGGAVVLHPRLVSQHRRHLASLGSCTLRRWRDEVLARTGSSSLALGCEMRAGMIASAGLAVTQFGRPPVLGSNEQIFGVNGQILGRDQSD